MNDLQKKQYEILKEFIKICDKHNLSYFLVGGTCLGAVRHKGFIPWDDDIDVGMLPKDFEKFLEIAPKEFEGTKYFLQTWRSDPNYIYGYAKIRDNSTTYIENFYKYHRMNHGVWIDIFPIYPITDKNVEKKKLMPYLQRFLWQVNFSYLGALCRKVRKETWFKDILLNIVGGLFYVFNIHHYRQKQMEKMFHKVPWEKGTLAGNWYYAWSGIVEALPLYVFEETVLMPFEDIQARVLVHYDEYLKCLYGDYMKLPPEDKRQGHHYNSGFDLNKPYDQYIKEHKI